jgi:LacI family sucrose operon transcriptional repressor
MSMKIDEIAKLAGVSPSAVSRYFNNRSLSDEKREAIRRIVEETGYRPSLQASTLRTKKTHTIGVIMPRTNSSSVGSMISGILSVLNEHGYQLLLADTENDPNKELDYISTLDEKQVDGIIFIGTVFSAAHKKALKKMEIPLVILSQKLSGIHCVYFDDYHSIYETTKLLIEKGCKKIGYLGAIMEDKAAGKKRYQGFCDALSDCGMDEQKNQYEIADFSLESGAQKAEKLWERFGPLDGLAAATDTIAIGAMKQLQQMGLRVPEDIRITGHGDSNYTKVTTPTLTTVHYDYRESGVLAARMMLELLENGKTAVTEMMLGYTLVEKDSTK